MYKVWHLVHGCFCFSDQLFETEEKAEQKIAWLLTACITPGINRCWYEIVKVG